MKNRRIRSASNNGGITPVERPMLLVDVLDGRLNFVFPCSGFCGSHASQVCFAGDAGALLQNFPLIWCLDLAQFSENSSCIGDTKPKEAFAQFSDKVVNFRQRAVEFRRSSKEQLD